MKILLATAGSRGDVEPFVALGERALADGHEVRLVAPDNTGVDTGDLGVVSMGVDYTRIIESQGVSPIAALRSYRSIIEPTMRGVIVRGAQAAFDYRPDVIVYHPKVASAPLVADALNIPHVLVEIVPALTPTRAFPAAGTVAHGVGALNRLTYQAVGAASTMFRSDLADVRAMLGTPKRAPSSPAATLMPISPSLLPRPSDWPASVHLTGAWARADHVPSLEPEVADFVANGPFIYAGFGSMAMGDASARGRALPAARDRGRRADGTRRRHRHGVVRTHRAALTLVYRSKH